MLHSNIIIIPKVKCFTSWEYNVKSRMVSNEGSITREPTIQPLNSETNIQYSSLLLKQSKRTTTVIAIFNIIDASSYINNAWQALTLLHFSRDRKLVKKYQLWFQSLCTKNDYICSAYVNLPQKGTCTLHSKPARLCKMKSTLLHVLYRHSYSSLQMQKQHCFESLALLCLEVTR